MKKALLLLLASIAGICSAQAATPPEGVDSTLFVYYQWCNTNRQNPDALLKADTLLRLSIEKKDVRMQCVAMQLKADYYYFTNNLDSLKAWIPRVQEFSRTRGQLKYYYFTWSRLILYYTKRTQFTLAQYELERYLTQAKADDYKPATADAYLQLAHLYRTKSSTRIAAEYYRKAIDFILKNDLDKFSISTHYSSLAAMLISLEEYDAAMDAIEKGKQSISLSTQIWEFKALESRLYVISHQVEKAKALLKEIKTSGAPYISEIRILETELAIYKECQQYKKAIATINGIINSYESGKSAEDYYASLYNERAGLLATQGLFEAAYNDLKKYSTLYRQKITSETESSLDEFATLLDVNRLDKEKIQLQQQAQTERLRFTQLIVWSLGMILLLAGIFIAIQIRTNRKLKRAMLAAEESNQMKGSFIRSVTHEINTPLNAIVGFSELAASHPADDQERASYIDIIRRNSTQLQKLVNDVLYISDLEAMSDSPSTAPVDINKCCLACIEKASESCPSGVQIRFEPANKPLTAITSHSFLTKAINELITNAMQFTTTGEIVLSYKPDITLRRVIITITDTGTGIRPEDAERIFERFHKANTFSNGMGLGLTVCRLIAQALGGTLQVDTQYTAGARFVLTLPIN